MRKDFIAVFLVSGLLMGVLTTWQFKTEKPIEGHFPTDELEAREALFKTFLDEQAYLQSRIVSLREQIAGAQSDLEIQSQIANLDLLEDLKREAGLEAVSGPGVTVLLDDSGFAKRSDTTVSDTDLVRASDIRDVVNVLNAASAEAVAVNNQRIIASSSISSVGSSILVNNAYIAPPFNISAIADHGLALQRLLSNLGELHERREKGEIIFEISSHDKLGVPVYNGDLRSNHINLIE